MAVYSQTELSVIAQPFTAHLLYLHCQGAMSVYKADVKRNATVCLRAFSKIIMK